MALIDSFFEGHLYEIWDEPFLTWEEADASARNQTKCSLQGNLVSITSQREKDFVDALFIQSGIVSNGVWIGLNDRNQEGNFEWTTGEAYNFSAWADSEPSNMNSIDAEENCVHGFFVKERDAWNDANCDRLKLPYIVEYECEVTETHNGHIYSVTNGDERTWDAANNEAQSRTACGVIGHLVTITSQEEQDVVHELYVRAKLPLPPQGNKIMSAWIGLSDLFTEGVFQWVTGEPLQYSLWAPNEPNDFQGVEDCAGLLFEEDGNSTWNDSTCNRIEAPFIIEFDCLSPTLAPISAGKLPSVFEAPAVATGDSRSATSSSPTQNAIDESSSSPPNPLMALGLLALIPGIILVGIYLRNRRSRERERRREDPPATGGGPPSPRSPSLGATNQTPAFKDQCLSYDTPPIATVTALPLGNT